MAYWFLSQLLLVILVTPVFVHTSSRMVPNSIHSSIKKKVGDIVNIHGVRLSATPPTEPADPYHSNEKESGLYPAEEFLPGKYRSLNSAELMKSILPSDEGRGCPEFFEVIRLTPVVNGILKLVYDTDLKVNDYRCSSKQGAANLTYLHPSPMGLRPGGELPLTIFHGSIPNETVECGQVGTLPDTFMSFMEIKGLLDQFLVTYPGHRFEPEKYAIHSKYYLYLGINDESCMYLQEKDVDAMVSLIYETISDGISESVSSGSASEGTDYAGEYIPEMNAEDLLHSQIDLNQLCPCSTSFPKNITLMPASDMDGENKNPTQGPMEGGIPKEGEVEIMPMPILWEGQRCAMKRVYSLEDIVSDRDHMFSSNSLGNLMLHGVVEKLFDEIRPEIRSFIPKALTFESKQRILLEQGNGLEGMRAVITFKGGSSCGSTNITDDVVVLLEVFHILHQLSNSVLLKKRINDTLQWESILREEAFKKSAVTMHLFKRNATSNLEVCTYTASTRAVELLAPACEQFTPFGSTDPAKIPIEGGQNTSAPQPQRQNSTANSGEQSIPKKENGESQNEGNIDNDPTTSYNKQSFNTTGDDEESESGRTNDDNSNAGSPTSTIQPDTNMQETPSVSVLPSSSARISTSTPSASASATSSVNASATPSPRESPSMANSSVSVSPSASNNSTQNTTTGALDDSACFPGAAQVLLADGSVKALKDLKVGDYVRDGEGEYSRVLLFAHANPDVMSSFVLLKFNSGALPISAKHYLPVNGTLLTAESVKVGDTISLLRMNPPFSSEWATVTGIGRVAMKGLYNPQTSSGSLAVLWKGQPVITSTYTSSLDPTLAHIMMWPLRWVNNVLGIVLPLCSHFLRDGSAFWHRVLPRGPSLLYV